MNGAATIFVKHLMRVCAANATAIARSSFVSGTALPWKDSSAGIVIDTPSRPGNPDPTVVALERVAAR